MAQVSLSGVVWRLTLTHQECESLAATLATVAAAASPAPGLGQAIAAASGVAAGIIQLMDSLGGDQGVVVSGVTYPSVAGVLVVPNGASFVGTLFQAAEDFKEAVTGATIIDFVMQLSSKNKALSDTLGIATAVTVFELLASGNPLGWAISGAAGLAVDLFGGKSEPDPNSHGGIHADRTSVAQWESFILASIPPGHISLLGWQGLFSAQQGGGGSVFANRPKSAQWETWTLVRNQDGTVSLQSFNGHYFTAKNGGGPGSFCLCDQTTIGPYEKFHLQSLPTGHVALKTQVKGTYVSVQSGV